MRRSSGSHRPPLRRLLALWCWLWGHDAYTSLFGLIDGWWMCRRCLREFGRG